MLEEWKSAHFQPFSFNRDGINGTKFSLMLGQFLFSGGEGTARHLRVAIWGKRPLVIDDDTKYN